MAGRAKQKADWCHNVKDVAEWVEAVNAFDTPVTVVEVYTSWFGACKVMEPTINEIMLDLEEPEKKVRWLQVDVAKLENDQMQIQAEEEKKRKETDMARRRRARATESDEKEEEENEESGEENEPSEDDEERLDHNTTITLFKLEEYTQYTQPNPLFLIFKGSDLVAELKRVSPTMLRNLVMKYLGVPGFEDADLTLLEKLMKPSANRSTAPYAKFQSLMEDTPGSAQSTPKYQVEVTVVQGKNIKRLDENSESDPYCLVAVGRFLATTKTITNEPNPEWNQKFIFSCGEKSGVPSTVEFEVRDKDQDSTDDLVGYGSLSLEHAWEELEEQGDGDGNVHRWLPLKVWDETTGQIEVDVVIRVLPPVLEEADDAAAAVGQESEEKGEEKNQEQDQQQDTEQTPETKEEQEAKVDPVEKESKESNENAAAASGDAQPQKETDSESPNQEENTPEEAAKEAPKEEQEETENPREALDSAE